MTDRIDRILSEESHIEPSSGLADTVMQRILEESDAPPPVPFPWLRFALGTGASLALLVSGIALGWFGGPDVVPDKEHAFSVGLPAATLLLTYVAARYPLRLMRS